MIKITFTFEQLKNIVKISDYISNTIYIYYAPKRKLTLYSFNNGIFSETTVSSSNINSTITSIVTCKINAIELKRKLISIPPKTKHINVILNNHSIKFEYNYKNCKGEFTINTEFISDFPRLPTIEFEYVASIPKDCILMLKSIDISNHFNDSYVDLSLFEHEWRLQSHSISNYIKHTYKLPKKIRTDKIQTKNGAFLQISEQLLRVALNNVPYRLYLQSGFAKPLRIYSNKCGISYSITIQPHVLVTTKINQSISD